MKHFITFLFAFLMITKAASAQENPLNKGFGFGFQLVQYQKDFGFGLNVTSPAIIQDKIAIRLRGNLMYNEHLKNGEITWSPYSNITLGVVGFAGNVAEKIRLYGEGGVLGIFPSEEFSSKNAVIGGYGLFGFEFFMHESFNYFIEIGSAGTGATADKIPTKPIYSNGLSVSTGFRIYLP
jgi:hypothetical protein